MDSLAHEHETSSRERFSVTEYSWQVSYPTYAEKIARAQRLPRQSTLFTRWCDEHHNALSLTFPHALHG